MVLLNTWSICCFMGQTLLLKMPQGTLHFTFQPCTIRQVYRGEAKILLLSKCFLFFSLGKIVSNPLIPLPVWVGELCPCSAVQGSKQRGKE